MARPAGSERRLRVSNESAGHRHRGRSARRTSTWNPDEAARTRRGVWVALGISVAATALLELPLFAMMTSDISIGRRLRMAAYLTPQALAFSLPLGLAVATGWLRHGRARTPKVAAAALLAAVLTSAAMFVNLGWVTPDANQAFREGVTARGDGELRFGELRSSSRSRFGHDGRGRLSPGSPSSCSRRTMRS